MNPVKLTARQQQILSLIESAVQNTGAPPTRAEIAAELGFKSANAAEEHLQALARKGVIQLVSGTSRGIRLKSASASTAGTTVARGFPKADAWPMLLTLPLVGRVAAGSPILAQEHIDQTYSVQPALFNETPDYLLRVRGMSMRDIGILDGDLLAVKATREARQGQVVVARVGDEVTVKRFHQTAQGITLLPENPDYAPIAVLPGDPFSIEGRAVGLIRHQLT